VLTHSHTRPSLAVKGGWARATCEASDHAITNRHYCPRCNNASDLILIAIEDGGAVFHARQRIPLPRACRRGVYNNSSPLRETNQKHPQQKFNKCKENIELTILDHPQHYTHCIILCQPSSAQATKPSVSRTEGRSPSISQQKMCRSFTIEHTNCGHNVHHPMLCTFAQQRRPVLPCQGWKDTRREYYQAEDTNCTVCARRNARRVAEEPWTNRNNGEDVPIRLRRDSLPQRYVPTPPPVYTSRYQYGSGYGSEYGYGDEGRRAADPDPSQREVHRRVADWAEHVPPPTHISAPASSRREVELYRPREHNHSHRARSSSSHHSASASGNESHVSRSSRHRSNIYDPRSEIHPRSRTQDSYHGSNYPRHSDQEPRRRHGYPPSLPPAPDTTLEVSQTTTYIDEDGSQVTETSTYISVEEHRPERAEEQSRSSHAASSRAASSHRGSNSHSESGHSRFYRYP